MICGQPLTDMSEPTKMPTITPKRILVVDDEPPVADTIKRVLVLGGHTVEIAETGEQASRLYDVGKYDLIVTDYALGKMTGLDLAAEIRAKSPKQPIILISAYAESLAYRTERLANIDVLLGKPFALEDLHAALVKLFPG
jgi:CheY-like chemotaxis protein